MIADKNHPGEAYLNKKGLTNILSMSQTCKITYNDKKKGFWAHASLTKSIPFCKTSFGLWRTTTITWHVDNVKSDIPGDKIIRIIPNTIGCKQYSLMIL
jgi:hypothetical protein